MDRCFRLATSAEFNSAAGYTAVHAIGSDGLQVGDTLVWHSWRLGVRLSHTSQIDQLRPCTYFREVMVDGGFRKYDHEHHFAPMDDGTRMRDEVHFAAPTGPVGAIMSRLMLRKYVMRLLAERHWRLKQTAESSEWRKYLHGDNQEIPAPIEQRPKVTKMQRFA